MHQNLIAMHHISKRFPGVQALKDVSFSLEKGEIHALLGENGAGKSTLIKVLTGVETCDEGTIHLEGKPIAAKTPQEAQRLGISTVYQEVNLCPNLSVTENLFIGRERKRHGLIDWEYATNASQQLLKMFNLDIDVSLPLSRYSVAIQQMVAIARAVDISAKVLILDEPTSSLSTVEVQELFKIMRMLKERGMGIMFVTHFLDQVYGICDTITILRNGEFVGTYPTSSLSRLQLVGKMIGKEYIEMNATPSSCPKETFDKKALVELHGASSNQIKNIHLSLEKGEVMGFGGLLGSGRSETARMLFGADQLTEGTLMLAGREVHLHHTLDAIRNGIAFCPEDRKSDGIIGELSIRENIILALQAKRGVFTMLSRSEADRIALHYIQALQIKTPSPDQLIKNLSGGNQQKVILARALATNPELLILDEPTRGIDVGTKAEIQKMVRLLAEEGMALVFISSEIDEMLRCCNHMVIMRDKQQVGELVGSEITEAAIMECIAGGAQ
ncbi:sugar ABC transporter ATP-binding protein [Sphaerochaeta sp.]|uniref:sugar ABC transporter ATP-binding protein n=1 Tax=Sphaerochaeta sp. TaxID=1972642 RepID=UPI003D0B86D6